MFDFVSGYICGMVLTFWLLCFLWVQIVIKKAVQNGIRNNDGAF